MQSPTRPHAARTVGCHAGCRVPEVGQRFPIRMVATLAALLLGCSAHSVLAAAQADAGGDPPATGSYRLADGGFQLYRSPDGQTSLTLGGQAIARYASWDWFGAPGEDPAYDYGFARARVDLRFRTSHVEVFIQPQFTQMVGLPDDAVAPPPRGPAGMGGLYYLHNQEEDPGEAGFHQAYLRLHDLAGSGLFIQGGRFAYSDGLEVMRASDGKKFNALKEMRLGDRMISPFDWSAFARSFDGGMLGYDDEWCNVTTSYTNPTQGGWDEDMNSTIADISIATATVTAKKGAVLPQTELAVFYYDYRDSRQVTQRVDNSGIGFSPDGVDIAISMLGGHALGIYDAGPGQFDVVAWGGAQFGDWYGLDHQAYAVDAEIGYQFTAVPWKPWLRLGYFLGSGDSDPTDGTHGTFFQMAPGTRKYQLLPFCNLMNAQDLFAQAIVTPHARLTLRSEYHLISLAESADRWYMGSGPTQDEGAIFGYLARPSNGERDLAQEWDVVANYTVNPHFNLLFSYSHVIGGEVVEGLYSADGDADHLSLELQGRF